MEDSARVAECFNSFNDSDSWPGGFTEGSVITAERVFDAQKKNKDIRVIVAYKDDKVVGFCNVCNSDRDNEAAYVGLLGVNPHFQGQGFGKALLIEAAETAAKAGKRRIDLHTWAGNLKALPLYKRTGYNWVPATRVLMESHIPGILGNKLFQPFFEKYHWYDSFKREIRQETDDIKEDGIGVFKYHFEGENGESLDVTVDREAKGICAFRLVLEGESLSASVQPKTHIGYIGFREYPVELVIENGTKDELPFLVNIEPSENISARLQDDTSGSVAADGSISINGVYSIPSGVREISRETNSDEKVPTQVEWALKLGSDEVSLFSGLIPTTPIKVRSGPTHPVLRPNGTEQIRISVFNNTSMDLKGELVLVAPKGVIISSEKIGFNLSQGAVIEEPVTISLESDVGHLLTIGLEVYLEEEGTQTCVEQKDFSIPVLGVTGAVAYRGLDNRIILETENIRGVMAQQPALGFTRFEYKSQSRILNGRHAMGLEVGYPFSSDGGEWSRLTPEILLESKDDHAEIQMTADSLERPGLRYHVTYCIQSGTDLVDTIVRYENTGDSALEDLGLRLTGWFGGIFEHAIIPLRGQLYDLGSIEWSGYPQIPKSPDDYHETWCASYRHQEKLLLGYIWDPEDIEEVRLKRGMEVPRIEYRLSTLAPGKSVQKTPLRLYIGDGDWRKVRSLYRKLYGITEPVTEVYDIRSDLEVEISPKSSKQLRKVSTPIIVDRSKTNNHEIRLRTTFADPIDASIQLRMPDGLLANGEKELKIEVPEVNIDKPFSHPLKITITDDSSWFRRNGEILVQFKTRNHRTALTAVVYDSALKVDRSKTKEENVTLHTISTGGYSIAACPEHAGTLVRFHKEGSPSVFYDTFPKVGPFIWWEKVYSGLSPIIAGMDVWDWESALHQESWTISNEKVGPWVGFKTTSVLQHSPGLKGVSVSFRYLILPGTPLMSVEFTTLNSSGQWKRPAVGYRGIPTPGGGVLNTIHTTRDNKRIVHEPTSQESELFAGREGWGAYENATDGTVLGIISAYKWDNLLYLDTLGEKAQHFGLRERRALKPGESTSMTSYIMITHDVDTVEQLKDLPEVIE